VQPPILNTTSEPEFAELVGQLSDPDQLTDLLREDHPVYDQRGAATVVQMRGWVLLALARVGVTDKTLVYVLEELDTGVDPYLVAAAAFALRSYAKPNKTLAPFVIGAFNQIRYKDQPVSFTGYGEYATSSSATSAVTELLITLAWLGPHAREVRPELEAVVRSGGLAKKRLIEANLALEAMCTVDQGETESCCALPSRFWWSRDSRRDAVSIESTEFEDHDEIPITFKEVFKGHPSIVVFFYTRCDNPLKCSLTVTKLARVQKLLAAQGVAEQIHTAAITYDPEFDLAKRIRRYGEDRSVHLAPNHRMLRTTKGMTALREHFKLGVNFIESLVNRHRVEAYVLDSDGRIAASFERLHWDEQEVVDRAVELLSESTESKVKTTGGARTTTVLGTIAAVGLAFFPKCPICWAAYLSMFGIAGLNQIPYSPWLQSLLAVALLINVLSVWIRGWFTNRMLGPYLVTAGAIIIVISKLNAGLEKAAIVGVVLTLTGSLLSALGSQLNASRILTFLSSRSQFER
jgi:protein SCO1